MKNGSHEQRPMLVTHEIKIATYDIDFAGHVSNISYLRWFEDMRLKLFEKYFSLRKFLSSGRCPVISQSKIEYKRPVKLFQEPRGEMWIEHMGNTSMTIRGEIYVEDKLTTQAEFVAVFVDLATGKPTRLPDVCRIMFNQATTP
jgi:acyl-CoA thioester hydrolase